MRLDDVQIEGIIAWTNDPFIRGPRGVDAKCLPDTIHALATEVLESRAEIAAKDAEIERAWRAIPARFALSPSDGGGIDTHRAIEDMAAEIAWLLEALILITREQQSEAQAGTGEYQRGYDDCIAAHAEIARAALGRDGT